MDCGNHLFSLETLQLQRKGSLILCGFFLSKSGRKKVELIHELCVCGTEIDKFISLRHFDTLEKWEVHSDDDLVIVGHSTPAVTRWGQLK